MALSIVSAGLSRMLLTMEALGGMTLLALLPCIWVKATVVRIRAFRLAALLFAQVIQNTAEQPQVGEDHAVKEGGVAAEGIKHLGGRGGDVHGEGVIFHLAAGIRQHAHGGVGLGRGGVTAGGGNAVLQVHHALFGNADERAGLLDAGENILDHRAALIHDKLDIDIVLLEPVDDIDGAGAVDLLLTGESEVNILLRLEALRNQMIGGSQYAVKGDLGIKGAASPQHAILDDALEGGFFQFSSSTGTTSKCAIMTEASSWALPAQ